MEIQLRDEWVDRRWKNAKQKRMPVEFWLLDQVKRSRKREEKTLNERTNEQMKWNECEEYGNRRKRLLQLMFVVAPNKPTGCSTLKSSLILSMLWVVVVVVVVVECLALVSYHIESRILQVITVLKREGMLCTERWNPERFDSTSRCFGITLWVVCVCVCLA